MHIPGIAPCTLPVVDKAAKAAEALAQRLELARTRLEAGALLGPRDVGALLSVDGKTVTRWAQDGRIATVTTPGGHRRVPAEVVRGLLKGERC